LATSAGGSASSPVGVNGASDVDIEVELWQQDRLHSLATSYS